MKKKIPIVILIVGFLLIVAGIAFGFYKEISEAKREKQEIEEKIVKEYQDFEIEIEKFNEIRSGYYEDINSNLYKESVEDEYDNWIKVLNDYTEAVDNVQNKSVYLQDKCIDKSYSNKDVISKCESFIIAYETVINYYTKDVNEFNEIINEYLKENDDKEEITEYNLKYSYTDIDSDGNFHGKD